MPFGIAALSARLDVSGHMHRLNGLQREMAYLAPLEEYPAGPKIGGARMLVANGDGEELEVPLAGLRSGLAHHDGQQGGADHGQLVIAGSGNE